MKSWKQWIAGMLAVLCAVSLLGCTQNQDALSLRVCAGGAVKSLDPIYAVSAGDQTVLTALYENLMRLAPDSNGQTTVAAGMAKSVDINENADGTVTYTFRLRSAKWSDGHNVCASDFVYAWQRLVNPASASPYASLLSVVAGYDAARASGDLSLLQATAENANTLVVVLSGHYDWFLTEVCTATATMPVQQDLVQKWKTAADEEYLAWAAAATGEPFVSALQPWWGDLTATPTNGPYQVTAYQEGRSLTASLFDRYYGDCRGPTELNFRFAETTEEAWALYEAKQVDFVWEQPETELTQQVTENPAGLTTNLSTYSVLANCAQSALADPLVRRAMSLVLDRTAVAAAAGVTAQAAVGLIPSGVPESEKKDFRTCGGEILDNDPETYAARCEEALKALQQAGYEDGRDLPEMEYLYVDGNGQAAAAAVVCQIWAETLRLKVTPRAVTEAELTAALKAGDYMLAGRSVKALCNDAEAFLLPWASDAAGNVIRYTNSAYDTLLAIIAGAEEGSARLGCLHDAESLLLEDAAVMPLYTTLTRWELREGYTGLLRDARGWFSFSNVHLWTE